MSIKPTKVAAWNVAKGLGDSRAEHIFEGINRLDAQVIFLSEAYLTDYRVTNEEILDKVKNLAKINGYKMYETGYDDEGLENDPKRSNQHGVVLGRQALKGATVLRLGSRNAFQLSIFDEKSQSEIQAVAAHFSDKNESSRNGMANALISQLDLDKPTLLLGDLNSMYRGSVPAKLLNSYFGKMGNIVSKIHPRTNSLAERLIGMADGSTMNILQQAGFKDGDQLNDSTFKFAGLSFGQLDHIMFAGPEIVARTTLHRDIKGSDHVPISAIVHINQKSA